MKKFLFFTYVVLQLAYCLYAQPQYKPNQIFLGTSMMYFSEWVDARPVNVFQRISYRRQFLPHWYAGISMDNFFEKRDFIKLGIVTLQNQDHLPLVGYRAIQLYDLNLGYTLYPHEKVSLNFEVAASWRHRRMLVQEGYHYEAISSVIDRSIGFSPSLTAYYRASQYVGIETGFAFRYYPPNGEVSYYQSENDFYYRLGLVFAFGKNRLVSPARNSPPQTALR